ncbi:MAG: hypothetical protein PHW11_06240 [Anaerolineaceae bacterium]|jgi:hypothetical protein|nr:hypothetical protein [Anaerolineaceae bacterium]MDD4042431.1 hypothetical protein [Anaerolineaceae bacterium]MDD4577138.1 hypothetical protein [Anaerolineaceae bacterium]
MEAKAQPNLWYEAASTDYNMFREEIEKERARLESDPRTLTPDQRRSLDYLDDWLVRARRDLDRYDLPVDHTWTKVRHEAQTTWDNLKREVRKALHEIRS